MPKDQKDLTTLLTVQFSGIVYLIKSDLEPDLAFAHDSLESLVDPFEPDEQVPFAVYRLEKTGVVSKAAPKIEITWREK